MFGNGGMCRFFYLLQRLIVTPTLNSSIISANTIRGGTLSYINTKHLMDPSAITDPDAKPLDVEFINVSTQAIHEHTVAQVYTSALRMLEFRAGVTISLCNK